MADNRRDLVAALAAPVINSTGLHYNYTRYPVNIELTKPLECGTKIYVHGAASPFVYRFSINLTDGYSYGVFHFNPRFDEYPEVVVRNTLASEGWGSEERHGGFPFVAGEPFLICIAANPYGYEVEVNGRHFCAYKHRKPLRSVTHVNVIGEVTIYGIHITPPSMSTYTSKEEEIDQIDFDVITLNDVSSSPVQAENPDQHVEDSDNNNTSQTADANVSVKPKSGIYSPPKPILVRNIKRMRLDVPEHTERQLKSLMIDMRKQDVSDEFAYFAYNVASQLRQMSLIDALECQCEILNVLKNKRVSSMSHD